jgi:hypothetical protein
VKPKSPNTDPRLHGVDGSRSFAAELAETADDLRQLASDFGLRPYRVFSVRIRWSGDTVGAGEPRVVLEEEFLPTPRVNLERLRREAREPGGYVERGLIRMDRVSARYTEDQIDALCVGRDAPENEERLIEVRIDGRTGEEPTRRRFAVAEAPFLRAEGFEWIVRLTPQDDARKRDGSPALAPRSLLERDRR